MSRFGGKRRQTADRRDRRPNRRFPPRPFDRPGRARRAAATASKIAWALTSSSSTAVTASKSRKSGKYRGKEFQAKYFNSKKTAANSS